VIDWSALTTAVPRRGGVTIVIVAPAGTGAPLTVSLASGLNVNGVAHDVAGVAEQS